MMCPVRISQWTDKTIVIREREGGGGGGVDLKAQNNKIFFFFFFFPNLTEKKDKDQPFFLSILFSVRLQDPDLLQNMNCDNLSVGFYLYVSK